MNQYTPILNSMSSKEKIEARKLLREEKEIHCLDRISHIKYLAVAIMMPLGSVKSKLIKDFVL